jgi:hypothetical protein
MSRAGPDEEPPFDFWPYFHTIPAADFCGYDRSAGEVFYVYRDPTGQFEHVLVNSTTKNVFMVVVLNRQTNAVHGHHLLNLNEKYGLEDPPRA